MTLIDIGPGADTGGNGYSWGGPGTLGSTTNPANATGTLTAGSVWATVDITGMKLGTFYGSGADWTCRGAASLGSIAAGSKQTVTGLSFAVATNDVLLQYHATGNVAVTYPTAGALLNSADTVDHCVPSDYHLYTNPGYNDWGSIYATGTDVIPPTVIRNKFLSYRRERIRGMVFRKRLLLK